MRFSIQPRSTSSELHITAIIHPHTHSRQQMHHFRTSRGRTAVTNYQLHVQYIVGQQTCALSDAPRNAIALRGCAAPSRPGAAWPAPQMSCSYINLLERANRSASAGREVGQMRPRAQQVEAGNSQRTAWNAARSGRQAAEAAWQGRPRTLGQLRHSKTLNSHLLVTTSRSGNSRQ